MRTNCKVMGSVFHVDRGTHMSVPCVRPAGPDAHAPRKGLEWGGELGGGGRTRTRLMWGFRILSRGSPIRLGRLSSGFITPSLLDGVNFKIKRETFGKLEGDILKFAINISAVTQFNIRTLMLLMPPLRCYMFHLGFITLASTSFSFSPSSLHPRSAPPPLPSPAVPSLLRLSLILSTSLAGKILRTFKMAVWN